MVNKKKKIFLISSIILVALLIISVVFFFVSRNTKEEQEFVIKENVSVITSETDEEYQPISVDEDSISFAKDPKYEIGDVIVAGIIDTAPEGFIRKVIGVENKNDIYIYKTEYAVLTEVFEEAHIIKDFAITENGVYEIDDLADINMFSDASNNPYTNDERCSVETLSHTAYSARNQEDSTMQLVSLAPVKKASLELLKNEFEYKISENTSISGDVGIDIWVEVEMDIEDGEIKFGLASHIETAGELLCSYTDEVFDKDEYEGIFEKTIFETKLPNFQFTIGYVPVVITNDIAVNLEANVQLEGSFESKIDVGAERVLGFEYTSKNGKITEINEKEYKSDGIAWDTKANASGNTTAGIVAHLMTKLYGSAGADVAAGIEGSVEGEVSANANANAESQFKGYLEMSIYPKAQGSVVVSVPIVDKKLLEAPLFEVKMEPFWEKTWEGEISIVSEESKISLLVFEPGWAALGIPDDYSEIKWWSKYAESEKPSFYERDAIEHLEGTAKTDWILQKDTFSDRRYIDGSNDVEGLTVTYYEAIYDGKTDLDCRLICSPFTRWSPAFVKVYIDEQYFTTIEYPSEVTLMNQYMWDICSIKDGKFNVVNSTTTLSEWTPLEDEENEKEGHINGVLMVGNYLDCDKLIFSTIDNGVYLKSRDDGAEEYSLLGNTIISPVLDLYKNDMKTAVVSVIDYDCSTVEALNSSYKKPDVEYEIKYLSIDNCSYSYLESEDGEILPIIRGQLYIGSICLYPVVHFDTEVESAKELESILEELKWSYEWSFNDV